MLTPGDSVSFLFSLAVVNRNTKTADFLIQYPLLGRNPSKEVNDATKQLLPEALLSSSSIYR